MLKLSSHLALSITGGDKASFCLVREGKLTDGYVLDKKSLNDFITSSYDTNIMLYDLDGSDADAYWRQSYDILNLFEQGKVIIVAAQYNANDIQYQIFVEKTDV